jgi:DNA-binding YbaB/EbfC family protein
MFKGLGNIANLVKQATQMQGRMNEMKEKLGEIRVEGSAGGGMVTVEATGQQQITSCKIDAALLEANDCEMLEDLVVGAVNQALERAREAAAQEMAKVTGDINIPGLGDTLSKMGLGDGPS